MATLELHPEDATYPVSLADLPNAPTRLWVRGALPLGPRVAIVGTRRADQEACAFTERMAAVFAHHGVGVVSGGALGIDAAAHRGALDGGGQTWVVQAASLADPYPACHRRLFAEVLERGGWLSETPPGAPPVRGRFLARNRLIAALADHLIVVQAPARSGALSTARWAARLGRPVHVVPGAPWDPRAEGAVAWLDGRAQPCLGAGGVLRALGIAPSPARSVPLPEIPAALCTLADALSGRARAVDTLVERTGSTSVEVQRGLVQLLGLGVAKRRGAGWIRTTGYNVSE
ncbi:MAG: DNA-processing protein DprA [Sandaracinaceae bacterium]